MSSKVRIIIIIINPEGDAGRGKASRIIFLIWN